MTTSKVKVFGASYVEACHSFNIFTMRANVFLRFSLFSSQFGDVMLFIIIYVEIGGVGTKSTNMCLKKEKHTLYRL